jgi:hypothetical protein
VTRLLLPVVAAALLLAGAALAGDPLFPQKRHTPVDMAKARAIVLRASDLTGAWRSEAPGPDEPVRCKGFQIDEHDLVETGDADSRVFRRETLVVFSSASLYGTTAMAASSWKRAVRPGLSGCLAELAERDLSDPGITVRTKSAVRLAFPRLAPATVRYRIVFTLTGSAGALPLYSDIVYMRNARVIAGVFALSFLSPFPSAELKRLATLTARRMR